MVNFSEIEEEDFKLKDYNYLTNFHKKIQALRGTDIPVIVNFEENTEWDGYINTPKLSLEDDEILEVPNQSILLESYLVDFFSDMGISNCSIYGESLLSDSSLTTASRTHESLSSLKVSKIRFSSESLLITALRIHQYSSSLKE